MGKVLRFIPKSEHERVRLIREARAIYGSIFPSVDLVGEHRDKAQIGSGANADRSDKGLLS